MARTCDGIGRRVLLRSLVALGAIATLVAFFSLRLRSAATKGLQVVSVVPHNGNVSLTESAGTTPRLEGDEDQVARDARAQLLQSVRQRLKILSNGRYLATATNKTLAEYRLTMNASDWQGSPPQFFDGQMVVKCFQGKWILFFGDSRLRFLFASMAALVGGAVKPTCPEHRACPFGNYPGAKLRECSRFYYSGRPTRECDVTVGATTVSYVENQWAGINASVRVWDAKSARYPDIIFVNNGAWDFYLRNNIPASRFNRPPNGRESDDDRASFFHHVARILNGTRTVKVVASYPVCTMPWIQAHVNMARLEPGLVQDGWVIYDASLVASAYWAKKSFFGAWSKDILPMDKVPRDRRWNQCEGPHTYDVLADLEMQIMYNSLCIEA